MRDTFLRILILFGFTSAIIFSAITLRDYGAQEYRIIRDATGFHPSSLRIRKGDTVVFENQSEKKIWPASDFHPRHVMYPEFDPQKGISTGTSWSFTFLLPGTWGFHDHLSPQAIGTITVTGDSWSLMTQCNNMENLSYIERFRCWSDKVKTALDEKGLNAAFDVFSSIYESDPSFGADCHDIMHVLGDAAYRKFKDHQAVAMNPKTLYCGYGFYHGFVEAMLQSEGTLKNAVAFCEGLNESARKMPDGASAPFVKEACQHGMGHGTFDNQPSSLWGNAEAMTKNALATCNELMEDKGAPLRQCSTGVFNALANSYGDGKHIYGLYFPEKNPFEVCTLRTEPHGHLCYSEVTLAYIRHKDMPYADAIALISRIPNAEGARNAIYGYIADEVRTEMGSINMPKWGGLCGTIEERFQEPCIKGVIIGMLTWGPPGKEYAPLLTFCSLKEIAQHADYCAEEFLPRIRSYYSPAKQEEVCNLAPARYQHYCAPQ